LFIIIYTLGRRKVTSGFIERGARGVEAGRGAQGAGGMARGAGHTGHGSESLPTKWIGDVLEFGA